LKKISIFLPNLTGGGAERLAIYLAHDWIDRGFKVEIVLMQKHGELLSIVSPEIAIIDLKSRKIRNSIFSLYKYLRVSQPDIIWVGMWPLTSTAIISWILAKKVGSIYVIDHNQLSKSVIQELKVPAFFLKMLMKITYPFATGIMTVSNGVKEDLLKLGGFKDNQVKVIYNPAATGIPKNMKITKIHKDTIWGEGFDKHILSVGSLSVQKNYSLLIRAFSKISKNLNAKLIILGEGKLRPSLESLISELDLEDSVSLVGFVKDPYPWYLTADLYVLSSDWEGLPTVLIESLECGLPIVSTDCPSGPKEILEDGRYGKLVPTNNPIALSNAIELSLSESHDKTLLMSRADDFSIESISKQYLQYFRIIEK